MSLFDTVDLKSPRLEIDLCNVAILFHGQNHVNFDHFTQDFPNLLEMILRKFPNGRSDFDLSPSVLGLHRTSAGELKLLTASNCSSTGFSSASRRFSGSSKNAFR